jgi:type I restriction enzyme R subunit
MPHPYTEELLVELPAFELFAGLGWATVSALEEVFGKTEPSPNAERPSSPALLPGGEGGGGVAALGREMSGEVVLVARLRPALVKLNPKLPPEAIATAIDELTRDRSAMDLAAANREVYALLKDGIRVTVADREPAMSGSTEATLSG